MVSGVTRKAGQKARVLRRAEFGAMQRAVGSSWHGKWHSPRATDVAGRAGGGRAERQGPGTLRGANYL